MISITLPLLGLAALSAAQSSTVSLFLPDLDQQGLAASIAGSDPTANTYIVECATPAATSASGTATASTVDSDLCELVSALTLVEGPSIAQYTYNFPAFDVSVDCSLAGTTKAVCTTSGSGAAFASNFPLSSGSDVVATDTYTGTDIATAYLPVAITAGSATPGSAVSATTTGSPTNGSSTVTGTAKSGTSAGTSTASAVTKSTNAAMVDGPALGAGMLGAFGAAVAGALL